MNFDFDAWTGHSLSFGALIAVLAGVAPPIAALASALWFSLQIYESRTFQHWKRNRQFKSRARRLAKLRAKEKITLAEIAALEKLRHAKLEASDIVAGAKAEAAALTAHEETVAACKPTAP